MSLSHADDGTAPVVLDCRLWDAVAPALARLEEGVDLPPYAPSGFDDANAREILGRIAARMSGEYPFFHPLYAGQMLKPPHPIARAAYALAMSFNPNNHALDGGRVSSEMEKEAVAELMRAFAWDDGLGHLCGGGTIANLEALWVAGRLHPGKKIVASSQAHYTHERISGVLGLAYESVAVDAYGRMDLAALRELLARGEVGTVVATLGTTATGSVDPLREIAALCAPLGVRVHADAAYGGYFTLARTLGAEARAAFDALRDADSIVVDPHKHGLQPYGCGCVLFRDPSVAALYRHDSPYTYFTSSELHLGKISLECSRPGAAAVALWATQQLLPLVPGGAFASELERSLAAARELHGRLCEDARFITAFAPELDIVAWTLDAPSLAFASRLARGVFEVAERHGLYLALAELPPAFFGERLARAQADRATVTALRSVLMKPEHLDWIGEIGERLRLAATEALA